MSRCESWTDARPAEMAAWYATEATRWRRVLDWETAALWPVLEEICAEGVAVDGLSLFGDAGRRSSMRLIGRYRLGA